MMDMDVDEPPPPTTLADLRQLAEDFATPCEAYYRVMGTTHPPDLLDPGSLDNMTTEQGRIRWRSFLSEPDTRKTYFKTSDAVYEAWIESRHLARMAQAAEERNRSLQDVEATLGEVFRDICILGDSWEGFPEQEQVREHLVGCSQKAKRLLDGLLPTQGTIPEHSPRTQNWINTEIRERVLGASELIQALEPIEVLYSDFLRHVEATSEPGDDSRARNERIAEASTALVAAIGKTAGLNSDYHIQVSKAHSSLDTGLKDSASFENGKLREEVWASIRSLIGDSLEACLRAGHEYLSKDLHDVHIPLHDVHDPQQKTPSDKFTEVVDGCPLISDEDRAKVAGDIFARDEAFLKLHQSGDSSDDDDVEFPTTSDDHSQDA